MAAKKKPNKRLIVFGYSDFAVAALEALKGAGVVPELLVTRRVMDLETGERTRRSPAATWAGKNQLGLVRPADKNKSEWLQPILEDPPALALAVGWETPLPDELIAAEAIECVGLHASLLPKYRGAHPLRAAIAAGESRTGVSAYRIQGPDWKGPILDSREILIDSAEDHGDIQQRLYETAGPMVVDLVTKLQANKTFKEKSQDESRSSATPRSMRRHRRAPWWGSADDVYNRLRAYSPEPGIETFLDGKRVDILRGQPMEWLNNTFGESGTFMGLRSGRITVLCNGPSVFGIERLRPRGGEPISATRYARERGLQIGSQLV
jgi:methionyl-tRNA formyltransferase